MVVDYDTRVGVFADRLTNNISQFDELTHGVDRVSVALDGVLAKFDEISAMCDLSEDNIEQLLELLTDAVPNLEGTFTQIDSIGKVANVLGAAVTGLERRVREAELAKKSRVSRLFKRVSVAPSTKADTTEVPTEGALMDILAGR